MGNFNSGTRLVVLYNRQLFFRNFYYKITLLNFSFYEKCNYFYLKKYYNFLIYFIKKYHNYFFKFWFKIYYSNVRKDLIFFNKHKILKFVKLKFFVITSKQIFYLLKNKYITVLFSKIKAYCLFWITFLKRSKKLISNFKLFLLLKKINFKQKFKLFLKKNSRNFLFNQNITLLWVKYFLLLLKINFFQISCLYIINQSFKNKLIKINFYKNNNFGFKNKKHKKKFLQKQKLFVLKKNFYSSSLQSNKKPAFTSRKQFFNVQYKKYLFRKKFFKIKQKKRKFSVYFRFFYRRSHLNWKQRRLLRHKKEFVLQKIFWLKKIKIEKKINFKFRKLYFKFFIKFYYSSLHFYSKKIVLLKQVRKFLKRKRKEVVLKQKLLCIFLFCKKVFKNNRILFTFFNKKNFVNKKLKVILSRSNLLNFFVMHSLGLKQNLFLFSKKNMSNFYNYIEYQKFFFVIKKKIIRNLKNKIIINFWFYNKTLKLKKLRPFRRRMFSLLFWKRAFLMYFFELRIYINQKNLRSWKHNFIKKFCILINTTYFFCTKFKFFVKLFLSFYFKFKFIILFHCFHLVFKKVSYNFYLLSPLVFVYFYLINIKKKYKFFILSNKPSKFVFQGTQFILQKLLFLIIFNRLFRNFLFNFIKHKILYFIYLFSLLFIKNINSLSKINFMQNKYISLFKFLIKKFVYISFFFKTKYISHMNFNYKNSLYNITTATIKSSKRFFYIAHIKLTPFEEQRNAINFTSTQLNSWPYFLSLHYVATARLAWMPYVYIRQQSYTTLYNFQLKFKKLYTNYKSFEWFKLFLKKFTFNRFKSTSMFQMNYFLLRIFKRAIYKRSNSLSVLKYVRKKYLHIKNINRSRFFVNHFIMFFFTLTTKLFSLNVHWSLKLINYGIINHSVIK